MTEAHPERQPGACSAEATTSECSQSLPVRCALICAGSLCVLLGAVGVVVPVLPTTPFLLVGAACYARSSPRFHRWLLTNRVLGAYIRDYLSGAGVPRRTKVISIAMLWVAIGSSAIFAVETMLVRILLVAVAIAVTVHIALVRSRKP